MNKNMNIILSGLMIGIAALGMIRIECDSHLFAKSNEGVKSINQNKSNDEEKDDTYEFYLTKDELFKDIDEGYVFRMDKTFKEFARPCTSGGNWYFYVNEDNKLSLNIAFSNLFNKSNIPGQKTGYVDIHIPNVTVEVLSPKGESVYKFEKKGEEITKDTEIKEQIELYPGKWDLKIDFAYVCRGSDQPTNLKISACYDKASQKDIEWLKKCRGEKDFKGDF